ncbi:type I secretion system permease/ATPase [Hoeflea prorocentri]|uniref:Type I secretion system permease/ATPase n=1 Tax=Hoeflea prorocentri TaxID=1922333 RepID=A0A9X3UF67_9HYPH|nr:type I secretion system permease/ATPase [Hoeflea prorocentri]MCY6379627.1 type I secretion system permease/ATPase [Hoeflea prorocentri]MDA5397427.1 type I secretion system permease/ATPase [Hoeflea prorocentri]
MTTGNEATTDREITEKIETASGVPVRVRDNQRAGLKRPFTEIGIFSFAINALMLVVPIYMLQVYDRVLPSASRETLIYLSIMAVFALGLVAGLEVVRSIYAARIAARFDIANTRKAMLAAMRSDRAPLGDIQSLRDLASIRSFIASRTVFALFDLPFAPMFIALLWFIHPMLFSLTAVGALLLAGLAIANQMVTAKRAGKETERGMAAMSTAQSFVRNADTLQAMGMTNNVIEVFGLQHGQSLSEADHVSKTNAMFAGLSRFVRLSLQIAVLGFGALLVLRSEMTAGMIFAASIISGRGLQPIDQLIGGWRQYVDVHAAWRRFNKAIAKKATAHEHIELPAPKGTLRMEDVQYAATTGARGTPRTLLNRISFEVPAGAAVGIVGPSGAGKSTLARMIVGAITPGNGCVRIDGADITHWAPESLGQHIGYLPQDIELLPGTIAQNIARFDPDAGDAAIIDAAKRAQVHDLIQTMPDGYGTMIGPRGLTLSGGQRQRIGLARAFFGQPRLLVLDEPNAHLDDAGEKALERAIDMAREAGTTVLIVTQRKAIVRKVDRLLVLNAGAVEDYGLRSDVLKRLGSGSKPQLAAEQTRMQRPSSKADMDVAPIASVTATNKGATATSVDLQ